MLVTAIVPYDLFAGICSIDSALGGRYLQNTHSTYRKTERIAPGISSSFPPFVFCSYLTCFHLAAIRFRGITLFSFRLWEQKISHVSFIYSMLPQAIHIPRLGPAL